MQPRQPLPRLWLMTDERQGERIWSALERMPSGSGVVFRHYRTPPRERRRLFESVRKVARRRRLVLVVAALPGQGRELRADGAHGRRLRRPRPPALRTASVHDTVELRAAERDGADLVFVSPVFPTPSHPGARGLGRARLGLIARQARLPVIALGGMDDRRARSLKGLNVYGWAGIGALTPGAA